MKHVLWVMLIIAGVTACSKKVPLDRDKFTSLLIDMHAADGTLETWQGRYLNEKDKYLYYNDLFTTYGIDRAEFDSCVSYYSGQSALFGKIYDAVVDTLSRRQTEKMRVWKQLTLSDTVNLFPGYTLVVADTIRRDSIRAGVPRKDSVIYETRVVKADTVYFDKKNQYILVELDSIVPGMYKFKTTLRLKKREEGRRNQILTYFLSDNNDTLKVNNQYVGLDTLSRDYTWTHYVADSMYNKLVIKIVESKIDPKAKKKMKGDREGLIWKTEIYKTYVTPKGAERLKLQYIPRTFQNND